ncbi:MAG TPA: hypothetical protein VF339_08150 [Gammaproteobacteria bacterium]
MIRSCAGPRRGRLVSCAVLATAAFAATVAVAEDHALAAKAGLLGLGVEYTHSIGDLWAVRVGWNGSQVGFDAEESGIEYDFDVVWDSFAVGVDLHPTRGPLRLFAGLLRNDNRLEAEALLDDEITVGDTTYAADDVGTLFGRVAFDDSAAFAGVGWDWSRRRARGVGVSFDIGVVSQGSPKVTLRASGPIADVPQFEDDIAAEEAELTDAVDDFDLLPFASIGVVFRF